MGDQVDHLVKMIKWAALHCLDEAAKSYHNALNALEVVVNATRTKCRSGPTRFGKHDIGPI